MLQTKDASIVLAHSFSRVSISRLIRGAFLLLFVFVLAACGSPPSTPTQAATISASSTSVPEATITPAPVSPSATGYPIKVYFSKFPDSTNKFDAVFPVDRYSPTNAVATYSIQLLIAGPTATERSAGYFSELGGILSGASSCSAPNATGGPDFTLALNMRGSKAQEWTATCTFAVPLARQV